MRFTRAAILTICSLGLLALCVFAQEPVTLKHGLKGGDVSYYKRSITTELGADMGGGSEEQVTVYYKQSVIKVEDGNLHLTLDYKGAQTRAQMMTGPNPFDELAGKSFDVVIAPDGKEIRPMDFAGKIPGGVRYMSVCAMADCILKEVHLPAAPVSPGDTWEHDLTQDKPNLGEGVDVEITGGTAGFKFEGMQDVDGRECAVISYEYNATSKLSIPQADLQPFIGAKIDLSGESTDKGTGEITFDAAEGRLIKYSYDGAVDMTIRFENVPDEVKGRVPESMKQAENINVLVELIDQQAYDAVLLEKEKPAEEGTGDEGAAPPGE